METSQSENPKRSPNRTRRIVVGTLVGLILVVLIQLIGEATDHQMANMASFAIGLVTVLFVGFQLHKIAKQRGRGNLVPSCGAIAVLAAVGCFDFDGFSGELIPQFRFRFGADEHPLRELSDVVAEAESDSVPEVVDVEGEPSVEAASRGFLGNDRTGIISRRQFATPMETNDLEVMWDQGIGKGWSSFAVDSGHAVTLEQRDDMDCLTCYSLTTGELLWMQTHQAVHQHAMGGTGPRSTPTIVSGKVYAQDAEGLVWCVDLLTGESLWAVDLLELAGWTQAESEAAITWGRAGSPLIVDGLCILPYGGPEANSLTGRSLIALDAETGKVRWTSGEDQISYASPGLFTLAGKRQIVIVNEKTVSGHVIENGELLWQFDWPGRSSGGANCAMAVAAGDDRILVGKGYGGGSALIKVLSDEDGNFSTTDEWTSTRFLKTKFTHACVLGDTAYAISNGWLEAIDVDECRRLWTQPRRSRLGQGQILLVEDVIVAQAENGKLVFAAVDREDYVELSRFAALSSNTWNIPTVAGRYLLLRNDRQAICYRLPPRE